MASVMAWPLMFSIAGIVHGIGVRADAQRDRERHRREHVGGVVFLVQRLVADHRPAGRLHHLDVEPLLRIEAHRMRHDDRRGAGDGDEADLEVLLLRRAALGESLTRRPPAGSTEEMAAIAVAAPTVFRNSRRWASTGKTARRTAASTTRLKRCSSLAGTADGRAWSAGVWSPPQLQRGFSRALGSNGSLNMAFKASSLLRRWRVLRLRRQAICQGPQTLGKWAH